MSTSRSRVTRRRRVWLGAGLVVVLLALLAAVTAVQAMRAYRALQEYDAAAGALREAVAAQDEREIDTRLEQLRSRGEAAHESTTGPHWWLAARLPMVGRDVDAVRRVAAAADKMAAEALTPLATAAQALDREHLTPRRGRIDLEAFTTAQPHLETAQAVLTEVEADLATIDADTLRDPLAVQVRATQDKLADAVRTVGVGVRAARLLPPMLGRDGPRTYLLVSQNNAEPRTLGGIAGQVTLVTADDGRIRLRETVGASSLGEFDPPVVRLSQDMRNLFGQQPASYAQNVTDSLDFDVTAEILRAMWTRRQGGRVDGVASLDPYALQLVLGAAGPVTTSDGTELTGDNAARELLFDVYARYPDPRAQDAFFAEAAQRAFDRVLGGGTDLHALGEALAEAVDQSRVMLWSAVPAEQAQLDDFRLGGALRRTVDDADLGVYLSEHTASKLGIYERLGVEVTPVDCGVDADDPEGAEALKVTVRMRSTVPRDLRQVPDYVKSATAGVPPGHISPRVLVVLPRGAVVTDVAASDGVEAIISTTYDGRRVAGRDFEIAPQQEASFTLTVMRQRPARAALGPLEVKRVHLTPGVLPENTFSRIAACESRG